MNATQTTAVNGAAPTTANVVTSGNQRKPIPIEPQLEQVPAELRELNQWVVWRYELDTNNKWTKVPYDSRNGHKAKTNDPKTWNSFGCAARAYQQISDGVRRFDGIGFVFAADDPYCGVDFDHCFGEIEFEKEVKPDAARWIEAFDSYTEYSVSGIGLHTIVKAKPGHNGKNSKAGFEIYDKTRFFTFTGDSYHDAPLPIAERQEVVDAFVAEYFPPKKAIEPKQRAPKPEQSNGQITINDRLQKAISASNGAEILALYNGDCQPCDFHELGEFPPQFEIKQKHYIVLCIKQLLETVKHRRFALARKNDFIFVFNGEYWREIDRDTLKDFLGKAAEKLGVIPIEAQHYEFKDRLYKQFLAAAHFDQVEPDDGKVLINLKNGTFEIGADSQELRAFRAEDFLKYQLPFDYNESAKAPIFTAYLNHVLPETELQNIVAEFFGYIFTRKLKLEKALLHGGGSNGKSVLFDLMNALLGRENTANYSLSDLMQEHNRAQIAHKLLNYGSEINASITKDVFKILVSGEQIMARLKYGNSFLMEDYAKLCFNCNELPKDIEQSEAYTNAKRIVWLATLMSRIGSRRGC
jgi:hypothetical protein